MKIETDTECIVLLKSKAKEKRCRNEELGKQKLGGVCAVGTLTNLYCHYYDANWIFNIADFVNYLWDVDNSGTKLVQIRLNTR